MKRSQSQRVIDHILAMITRGDIRPGQLIPYESELMRQTKVGRSSVREGVRGLVLMGILETRRKRGTILVSPISNPIQDGLNVSIAVWAIGDLFKVRALLEGEAAAEAAEHGTPKDLDRIEEALSALDARVRAGKEEFHENTVFHMRIAQASKNPVLAECIGSIIEGLQEVRQRLDRVFNFDYKRDILEHRAIVRAIKSRKPEVARAAMHAHLNSYIDQLKSRHSPPDSLVTDGASPNLSARQLTSHRRPSAGRFGQVD